MNDIKSLEMLIQGVLNIRDLYPSFQSDVDSKSLPEFQYSINVYALGLELAATNIEDCLYLIYRIHLKLKCLLKYLTGTSRFKNA